jgi:hypothetical protein
MCHTSPEQRETIPHNRARIVNYTDLGGTGKGLAGKNAGGDHH